MFSREIRSVACWNADDSVVCQQFSLNTMVPTYCLGNPMWFFIFMSWPHIHIFARVLSENGFILAILFSEHRMTATVNENCSLFGAVHRWVHDTNTRIDDPKYSFHSHVSNKYNKCKHKYLIYGNAHNLWLDNNPRSHFARNDTHSDRENMWSKTHVLTPIWPAIVCRANHKWTSADLCRYKSRPSHLLCFDSVPRSHSFSTWYV